MGLFDSIKSKLSGVFSAGGKLDDDFYDSLEEAMILSDIGAAVSMEIVESLRVTCRREGIKAQPEAKLALRGIIRDIMDTAGPREMNLSTKPSVVLVIGVNGVGKTTTIGKLAGLYTSAGKKVLLCAGDTFRAAAAEQLSVWAERSRAEIVRQHEGADPASVLFDAITAGKARGSDIIICDTAGRLHNKQNLMNELAKISRILDRELPGAARETLLVIDAATGQNGLAQAKSFCQTSQLTGIVLTKLDGTAKGGIAVAVAREMGVPVKFAGLGERISDLTVFDPEAYAEAIVP